MPRRCTAGDTASGESMTIDRSFPPPRSQHRTTDHHVADDAEIIEFGDEIHRRLVLGGRPNALDQIGLGLRPEGRSDHSPDRIMVVRARWADR